MGGDVWRDVRRAWVCRDQQLRERLNVSDIRSGKFKCYDDSY